MRGLIVVLAVLFSAGPALAQRYTPANAQERAAAELVDLLKLEESNQAAIDLMVESMASQNPMFNQIRDVFTDFFKEYSDWEKLYPEYVRLYAEAYSEAELRELIAFYKSPVGRKTVDMMPRLMQQGAEIGQRQVEPHLPELQRRIQARLMGGG